MTSVCHPGCFPSCRLIDEVVMKLGGIANVAFMYIRNHLQLLRKVCQSDFFFNYLFLFFVLLAGEISHLTAVPHATSAAS